MEARARPGRPTKVQEEAGLQLKLRSLVHQADITCVTYAPSAKAVAAVDKTGEGLGLR